MVNKIENEIAKMISNPGWGSLCTHHTNALEKGFNPSLPRDSVIDVGTM